MVGRRRADRANREVAFRIPRRGRYSGAVDLLAHTVEDTVTAAAALGVARPAATAAHSAWFREGRAAEPWVSDRVSPIERTLVDHDTVKFTMRLPDGLETESVVIPMYRDDRVTRTLCVSSQVGCAMGCGFC